MKLLKNFLNILSPNLRRYLRNLKINYINNSAPQISKDGNIKFFWVIPYENYEPAVVNVLLNCVKESDVFVNIGANSGVYCLKMSYFVDRIMQSSPSEKT